MFASVILNSLVTLVKASVAPKTAPEMVYAKMVHAYVSKDSLARTAQSLNARTTAMAMASVLTTRHVVNAMMASSLRHAPTNIAQAPKVAKNAQEMASALWLNVTATRAGRVQTVRRMPPR